ncbi:MAG: endonuclease MutS2 [Chloroflexi bacterium]|nr:endonuclease MutS2 [Chloroflexota bacterium]
MVLLEFTKIRERLAQYTAFSGGRELALALRPSPEVSTVLRSQQETQEAQALLESRPGFGLGSVRDVRPAAEQARLGGVLTPQALLEIMDTLAGARAARNIIVGGYGRTFLALIDIVRDITPMPDVEAEIARCVDPRGDIKDSASPLLGQLRREVRQVHDRLVDRLQQLVNSQRGRHVLQDGLVTLRNGRYVVPVKADFRGEFKGVVHDVSSSGATLFMEPLETLDLGNTWRELQLLEAKEVARILRRLSELVGERGAAMVRSVDCLAWLDLVLAKARYGQRLRATFPTLHPPAPAVAADRAAVRSGAGRLFLAQARHPLLTGHVVPITVTVGEDYHALIITGPNTGGKTVALKTVGLLCLMAQAGMSVPAAEGSELPVFRGIYADIGDEQSIEQSLSTFSSHLRTIIGILAEADAASLVLLDELGAGTDPAEGSALARAILTDVLRRGVTTIATTHHSELKAFAHTTPGARNASVEFDMETLAPTYRLVIGLPGQSNAIAIAERLGLPSAIVQEARSLLGPGHAAVENLLADLQRERQATTTQRAQAEAWWREAEVARSEAQRHLGEIETDKARRLQQAREQITQEMAELQRRLRKASAHLQGMERHRLEEAARELAAVREEIERPTWRPAPAPVTVGGGPPALEELRPGARVMVRGLGQLGEVLTPPTPEGEVEVQIGAFKAKVRADDLERAPRSSLPPAPPAGSWEVRLPLVDHPGNEVHLRGLTVVEALEKLEQYLHDAYLAGLRQVRIVHGKGTGTLRRAVRERLAEHPLVRAVVPAEQREGGEGVTMAELVA